MTKCRECELLHKLDRYRDFIEILQSQRNYIVAMLEEDLQKSLQPGIQNIDLRIRSLWL